VVMEEFASYEGTSGFLRWWPKALLVLAAYLTYEHGNHWLQFATLFVLCAWLHGRFLPWRFSVFADGLDLVFPFGRHVFLAKPATTVRIETIGAVAMTGRHRHLGYPLHDGVLYVPGRRIRLRRAFDFYGYRVV
jgi:hypothetical protein